MTIDVLVLTFLMATVLQVWWPLQETQVFFGNFCKQHAHGMRLRRSRLDMCWESLEDAVEATTTREEEQQLTIWLFNVAMENHSFLIGKPLSMGHLYHGYVSHNQRVSFCSSFVHEGKRGGETPTPRKPKSQPRLPS